MPHTRLRGFLSGRRHAARAREAGSRPLYQRSSRLLVRRAVRKYGKGSGQNTRHGPALKKRAENVRAGRKAPVPRHRSLFDACCRAGMAMCRSARRGRAPPAPTGKAGGDNEAAAAAAAPARTAPARFCMRSAWWLLPFSYPLLEELLPYCKCVLQAQYNHERRTLSRCFTSAVNCFTTSRKGAAAEADSWSKKLNETWAMSRRRI